MTTVEQFLAALAEVESSNNPLAWGDFVDKAGTPSGHPDPAAAVQAGFNPQAMGRWQVHPDRLVFEAKRLNIWPTLGETLDLWVERILRAIWLEESANWAPDVIAMYWHKQVWCYRGTPAWDITYGTRFTAALAKVS